MIYRELCTFDIRNMTGSPQTALPQTPQYDGITSRRRRNADRVILRGPCRNITVSCHNGDPILGTPGPYIYMKLGTRVPISISF